MTGLACVTLLCAALATGAAPAQERARLDGASVRVEVGATSDDATVVVQYTIVLSSTDSVIAVRAIPFFDLQPASPTATVDGIAAPVELRNSVGGGIGGNIVVPEGAPSDRSLHLELRYTVPGAVVRDADRLDIRAPVLLIDATPASAADDFFGAELSVPRGVTVTESFPAVPRAHASTGDGERYTLALPVVPSMVRWHAVQGLPPRLSFTARVDLALLVLIGGLAALGARALTRSA